MDAVKFIEERNRMCRSFDTGCYGCPACNNLEEDDGILHCAFDQDSTVDAKAQIAIVEKWSSAHPYKTRQSVFLERWPEAEVDENGILTLCPASISSTHRNEYGECANYGAKCTDCCREFWLHEVE